MVKFVEVSKKFDNLYIIQKTSFNIEPTKCTAIIGESGVGKTTIIRMMNGLEMPTSGKILVDGEQITKQNLQQIRFKIGFVFQNFNLFPHLTALENIIFSPLKVLKWQKKVATEKAYELLEKFSLTQSGNKYPSQLSGGQKQRVALIRAVIMNPKIILLDEPTSALDPNMTNEVGEIIEFLKKSGTTIIVVTHEVSFIKKYATNVIFCSKNIIEEMTAENFFSSEKPYIVDYLKHYN